MSITPQRFEQNIIVTARQFGRTHSTHILMEYTNRAISDTRLSMSKRLWNVIGGSNEKGNNDLLECSWV
jgi:hypothetical protein